MSFFFLKEINGLFQINIVFLLSSLIEMKRDSISSSVEQWPKVNRIVFVCFFFLLIFLKKIYVTLRRICEFFHPHFLLSMNTVKSENNICKKKIQVLRFPLTYFLLSMAVFSLFPFFFGIFYAFSFSFFVRPKERCTHWRSQNEN